MQTPAQADSHGASPDPTTPPYVNLDPTTPPYA